MNMHQQLPSLQQLFLGSLLKFMIEVVIFVCYTPIKRNCFKKKLSCGMGEGFLRSSFTQACTSLVQKAGVSLPFSSKKGMKKG